MSRLRARPDAAERAGRRLGVAAIGLVVLGAVIGPLALLVHQGWSPLLDLDTNTTRGAERLVDGVPGLLPVAQAVTHLGDPLLLSALTLVAVTVLLRRGQRRLALYVLACRAGALLLSTSIKVAVGRARPVFDEPVSSAFGLSFPSGHALGAAAFWLSAAVVLLPLVAAGRRPLVLPAAVAVAGLVAASRVLLGVHYLSDVTAGLVLGFGWTAVCTTLFPLWRREEGRPVEPYGQGLAPELRR